MTGFSDEDRALMEQAAERLVASRLSVPAIMMLETVTPMNMVAASMLHVLSPAWRAIMPRSQIERLARLLESREAIPEFIRVLDAAEERRRRASRPRADGPGGDDAGVQGPAGPAAPAATARPRQGGPP